MADEKAAEKEQEDTNDQTTDHSPDAAQMGASDGGGKSTWKDGPMKARPDNSSRRPRGGRINTLE